LGFFSKKKAIPVSTFPFGFTFFLSRKKKKKKKKMQTHKKKNQNGGKRVEKQTDERYFTPEVSPCPLPASSSRPQQPITAVHK